MHDVTCAHDIQEDAVGLCCNEQTPCNLTLTRSALLARRCRTAHHRGLVITKGPHKAQQNLGIYRQPVLARNKVIMFGIWSFLRQFMYYPSSSSW